MDGYAYRIRICISWKVPARGAGRVRIVCHRENARKYALGGCDEDGKLCPVVQKNPVCRIIVCTGGGTHTHLWDGFGVRRSQKRRRA